MALDGTVFFLCGKFFLERLELKRTIISHGGKVSRIVSSQVSGSGKSSFIVMIPSISLSLSLSFTVDILGNTYFERKESFRSKYTKGKTFTHSHSG